MSRNKDAALIPTDKIGPDPDQPREEFDPDELQRLAESLQTRGQLQPITVYWEEGRGLYVIVCGERRWRAAKLAGMTTMTATILARAPEPGERLALQLIENLLRSDLRPVEEAKAYRQLMRLNGWNAAQLSRELAVTESKVTRAMALLELPESGPGPGRAGNPAPGNGLRNLEDRRPRPSRPNSPPAWSARSSPARTPPGSSGSGNRRGQGRRSRTKPAPRRAEFATQHGQVTVVAAADAVIAALEEALAQARRAEQSAQSVNSEAA